MHHVTDDHVFKDEMLFYRFYCDEPTKVRVRVRVRAKVRVRAR
jgi:hypothetical protein